MRFGTNLGRQLEHVRFDSPEEVGLQPLVELLDLLGVEILKLLLERGQVGPRVRIEEAEQVKQLAHVVVKRCSRQQHLLSTVEILEPLEDQVRVALESLSLVDLVRYRSSGQRGPPMT